MEEFIEIKQTKLRNIKLEVIANIKLEEIKKLKPDQCCFKNRIVDAFILGACRSVYNNNTPKKLPKGKDEVTGAIPLPTLKDRDILRKIIQIIGYKYSLEAAEGDEVELDKCHEVILDLSKCISYAEKLFKKEWDSPSPSSFKRKCDAKNPDSKLVEDFNFKEFKNILDKQIVENE